VGLAADTRGLPQRAIRRSVGGFGFDSATRGGETGSLLRDFGGFMGFYPGFCCEVVLPADGVGGLGRRFGFGRRRGSSVLTV
jgi:hypothetical protein